MFERFTERARQVIVLAEQAARELRHNHIGTDHILLGVIREEQGVAARTLLKLGYRESYFLGRVASGTQTIHEGHLPFTANAKKSFELALREALSLGHNFISTEHILLGLLREEHIVNQFALDTKTIRNEIFRMLSGQRTMDEEGRYWQKAHKIEEETLKDAGQKESEQSQEKAAVTITYGGLTLKIEGDFSGPVNTQIVKLLDLAYKTLKK